MRERITWFATLRIDREPSFYRAQFVMANVETGEVVARDSTSAVSQALADSIVALAARHGPSKPPR